MLLEIESIEDDWYITSSCHGVHDMQVTLLSSKQQEHEYRDVEDEVTKDA